MPQSPWACSHPHKIHVTNTSFLGAFVRRNWITVWKFLWNKCWLQWSLIQGVSRDPIPRAMTKHVWASPARAVILHWPTFASATVHPQVNWLQVPCLVASLNTVPSQTKMLQNWWQGTKSIIPTPTSVHSLETLTLACCWSKKKWPPNQYLPLQECAVEQTEAKISHSNTICNSVYKYAWWLNLSSFWLLTCPVLLCHPHKNVFY